MGKVFEIAKKLRKPQKFLFLQGPVGAFFNNLADQLLMQGYDTHKINFNAGDLVFWLGAETSSTTYKGTILQWRNWLRNHLQQEEYTDIILYGDCRPAHKVAIAYAKRFGVRVHVFEEGYLRPNWVTCELGGTNAFSPIIKNKQKSLDDILSYINEPSPKHSSNLQNLMHSQLLLTSVYYTANTFLAPLFPKYKTHRQHNTLVEVLHWAKRYISKRKRHKNAKETLDEVLNADIPYFLFTMQLSGDYQIREHSQFANMTEACENVIESFAAHASKEDILIIKNHPLDNGAINYTPVIAQKSEELNIGERVLYIDGGKLPALLEKAKAVVTVNSTSGLQAIYHHTPTKILSDAVYDFEGLVDQQPLETFWQNPASADDGLYLAFRKYLLATNQIYGSFYQKDAMKKLVDNSVKHLLQVRDMPQLSNSHKKNIAI